MAESQLSTYTVYACCPTCKGIVGRLTAADELDSKRDEVTVVDAGFRPFMTGPGATAQFPVGHKLKADCANSHEFEVAA